MISCLMDYTYNWPLVEKVSSITFKMKIIEKSIFHFPVKLNIQKVGSHHK